MITTIYGKREENASSPRLAGVRCFAEDPPSDVMFDKLLFFEPGRGGLY